VLIVTGCAEVDDSDTIELHDQGAMCMYADNAGFAPGIGIAQTQEFEVGSQLVTTVQEPQCLSDSCDTDKQADCEIVRSGNRLIVHSYLSWTPIEADGCTMDCIRLTASCTSEPLEAGKYLVVHGADTHELRVPSIVQAPCD